jgi:hypothetical protein
MKDVYKCSMCHEYYYDEFMSIIHDLVDVICCNNCARTFVLENKK